MIATNMNAGTHRVVLAVVVLACGGCQEPADLAVPSASEVTEYYTYDGRLSAEVTGNVATVSVSRDPQLLRRGGSLWAKLGPYVFVFSDETHQLFLDYPGLAGVRVVTTVGGAQVASALLARHRAGHPVARPRPLG